MDHEEILHRCFRCGFCKLPSDYSNINCPSYLKYRFESFAPGGRMWLLRAWLDGRLAGSTRLQESLFSCATCNNCVQQCPFTKFKDQILQAFIAAKKEMVNQGALPPKVRDYLTAVYKHGNPYKKPQKKRGEWAEGLQVQDFSGQEYLLFVGDVGSFDPRGTEIARAVTRLFTRLGISFGILGGLEISDGNEVQALGESELFEHLAHKNLETFERLGARKIVTLSPHSYNALLNNYGSAARELHVVHYTQLLAEHIANSPLAETQNHDPVQRITIHDPCYLGRHNNDYHSVRKILETLPWVEVAEMARCKEDALCCGGGGGNFFTDLACSGEETSAKVRVREAVETGADTLVTCCPVCTIILQDAATSQGLEHAIRIQEISELIMSR